MTREWALLGGATAAVLGLVDMWYARERGAVSTVHLLDAPVELALAAAWARVYHDLPATPPPLAVQDAVA
jgi:hypothetical protein